MSVAVPLINGVRMDYSSIEIRIGGLPPFKGVKEISYKHTKNPGIVYGTGAQPLGVTRGQYAGEGSITIYREEWGDLVNSLGDGFMEARFNIAVMYAELAASPIQTDLIIGVLFKDVDHSASQGNDALVVKGDFFCSAIVENGKVPVTGLVK